MSPFYKHIAPQGLNPRLLASSFSRESYLRNPLIRVNRRFRHIGRWCSAGARRFGPIALYRHYAPLERGQFPSSRKGLGDPTPTD